MGNHIRLYREPGLRHCHRCNRRTFWSCEDCGRPTCLDCKIIETVALGGRRIPRFMCPRCRFKYASEDLGANAELWEAIVRRIEASGEPHPWLPNGHRR
jgi:hypothetical protein